MALERQLEQLEDEMDSGMWVPLTSTKKQISPNAIRGQITRFLAESGMTQKAFMEKAGGINPGAFHRFMKPGSDKNQWSACQNQTYWGAARFLAREKIRKKIRQRDAKKASKKRKREHENGASSSSSASSTPSSVVAAPLSKKQKKEQAEALLARILAVPGVELDGPIYDNCDIIRKKVNRFIATSGVGITMLLKALNLNGGSWASFKKLKGKGGGAANMCYPAFYKFFEQKRILEKKAKSKARKAAELNFGPAGYERRHDNGRRLVFRGAPINPDIFDIDKMAARRRELAERYHGRLSS